MRAADGQRVICIRPERNAPLAAYQGRYWIRPLVWHFFVLPAIEYENNFVGMERLLARSGWPSLSAGRSQRPATPLGSRTRRRDSIKAAT